MTLHPREALIVRVLIDLSGFYWDSEPFVRFPIRIPIIDGVRNHCLLQKLYIIYDITHQAPILHGFEPSVLPGPRHVMDQSQCIAEMVRSL